MITMKNIKRDQADSADLVFFINDFKHITLTLFNVKTVCIHNFIPYRNKIIYKFLFVTW